MLRFILLAPAALLGLNLALGAAETPTPTPDPTPIAIASASSDLGAWFENGRLLVSGSSLGTASEKEARRFAIKDAAAKAGDFLGKKGLGDSVLVRRGVEDSLLRETPLVAQDFGEVKIEDVCQERWSNKDGVDVWSMHLTLSIRIGKRAKK